MFSLLAQRWAESRARLAKIFAPVHTIETQVIAVCHTCNLRHNIRCSMARFTAECADWEHKHPASRGCRTEYVNRRRVVPRQFDDRQWMRQNQGPLWMAYGENTNFNFAYRTAAAIAQGLASLATSATWVAGWESAAIDNSSNKDLDILISVNKITAGTTPTTGTIIEVNSVSILDDSAGATWPDVFAGASAGRTVTSAGIKSNVCVPLDFLSVDSATSNRAYPMSKRSLAAQYGWICPDKSSLFITHNTAVNLNATAGNHVITQQSVYLVGA